MSGQRQVASGKAWVIKARNDAGAHYVVTEPMNASQLKDWINGASGMLANAKADAAKKAKELSDDMLVAELARRVELDSGLAQDLWDRAANHVELTEYQLRELADKMDLNVYGEDDLDAAIEERMTTLPLVELCQRAVYHGDAAAMREIKHEPQNKFGIFH